VKTGSLESLTIKNGVQGVECDLVLEGYDVPAGFHALQLLGKRVQNAPRFMLITLDRIDYNFGAGAQIKGS
jgi:hypothetical protein